MAPVASACARGFIQRFVINVNQRTLNHEYFSRNRLRKVIRQERPAFLDHERFQPLVSLDQNANHIAIMGNKSMLRNSLMERGIQHNSEF